ncbi:hypothetical protein [Gordonia sp. YY1]|uniref:hypothetical protein n=1 Tax=Gordonia sp. YY1 TaxID=396712 RepID=UPI0013312D7A|nr:hypothetical protein [Gordonia sp. YY1]KAF0969033.1 hypothetical protein BPODLACK_02264 [Gordonia sp. YY1]
MAFAFRGNPDRPGSERKQNLMNPTPDNPTPEAAEPQQTPDPDTSTAPMARTPDDRTPDDQPTERLHDSNSVTEGSPTPAPASTTSAASRFKTPILAAAGVGVVLIAVALGFGAGYITGDTTSDRPDRVMSSRFDSDPNRADGRDGPHGHFRGPGGPQRWGSTDDAPDTPTPSRQPTGEQPQPS